MARLPATGRMGAAQAGRSRQFGGERPRRQRCGPADVVTNVAEFGENLLTLAELQARLAAIELKQNIEGVKVGGAIIVAGAVLAMAATAHRTGGHRRAAGLACWG